MNDGVSQAYSSVLVDVSRRMRLLRLLLPSCIFSISKMEEEGSWLSPSNRLARDLELLRRDQGNRIWFN